jgi:hypothetical protein
MRDFWIASGKEFTKKTSHEKLDEVTSQDPKIFFILCLPLDFLLLSKLYDFCPIANDEEINGGCNARNFGSRL